MAVHRFSVHVPNPDPRSALVRLRLRKVTPKRLAALALDMPPHELEVTSAGITQDPCAEHGPREVTLKLAARSSADVFVVIGTAAPPRRRGGAVAFDLVDERGNRPAGGVLLACIDRPGPEAPGSVIVPKKPCPVVLARAPYPVAPQSDPRKPAGGPTLAAGGTVELVAPLTNPRKTTLSGVRAYLEHLGVSDASFAPLTWNVGDLAPGDIFYATWPIMAGTSTGVFHASIVVTSKGADPVRLDGTLRVGRKTDDRPPAGASPAGRRLAGRKRR